MDHEHTITPAQAIEYKVGWEMGVLTSRAEHWARKGMVPRHFTALEAQRIYEEAVANARCTWDWTKKVRKKDWYLCPRCDLIQEVKMTEKTFLTQRELNTIRGKAMVGHATPDEILSVFAHLDQIELELEEADANDMLGTEGWRHWMGLADD